MGASQSKKRRKEKKRRSSDFDLPRSASADVIRYMGVSHSSHFHSASNIDPFDCPQRPISYPVFLVNDTSKYFYRSLEGIPSSSQHSRKSGHYLQREVKYGQDLSRVGKPRDENVDIDYTDTSYHWSRDSCLNVSREDLFEISPCEDFSARSNQKDFENTSAFNLANGTGSDLRYTEANSLVGNTMCRDYQQTLSDTHKELDFNEEHVSTLKGREANCGVNNNNALKENQHKHKISLNAIEHDAEMTARYEEQKKMARQLRILRKHIHEQETLNKPLPTIILRDNEQDSWLAKTGALSNTQQSPTEVFCESKKVINDQRQCRRRTRNKFTKMSNYKNLDSHPIMSKLQNDQNSRLEEMEKRMKQIRMNAMQEAERRRFAEIFPAKDDETETDKIIQEARETFDMLKENMKTRDSDRVDRISSSYVNSKQNGISRSRSDPTINNDYLGDIVPVRVSTEIPTESDSGVNLRTSSDVDKRVETLPPRDVKESQKKSLSEHELWDVVDLGRPITWIWLPFLVFPLLLRFVLSFVLTTTENKRKSSGEQQQDFNTTRTYR